MTAFAAADRVAESEQASVTVKSVNHRFLDLAIKAPPVLAALEGRVRAAVQGRLARGRVEMTIAVESLDAGRREAVFDGALLEQVVSVMRKAREQGLIVGDLTPSDVIRLPQVLSLRPSTAEVDAARPDGLVDRLVGEALDALVAMRETEGRFLAADLDARVQSVSRLVDALERHARDGQRALDLRLRDRVAELPPDVRGDATAVAQEIVRVVARSDVEEELVRLRSHLAHWRSLADGPEPCGRKLDFLVQEMNREINTIGAKVEGPEASHLVIEAKAELERIREQVQNVE